MLKKILSILMLTMIATTTIVRAELWLPDSDDSDEGLLINDPVTDTQVTESPMKTVASKAYVDTKIETKQLKIPAAGQPNVGAGETVMTYTSTGNGQIGERGLYSDISSYNATTDGDKLITASALNDTFTNLPTTPTTKLECANQADGCTLWTIVDQTAYGISGNGTTTIDLASIMGMSRGTDRAYRSNSGGNSGNASTYGVTQNGTWVVDYGNGKRIRGKSQCSSQVGDNNDGTWTNPTISSTLPDASGGNCYCQLDGYTTNGDNWGNMTALSAPWVFSEDFSDYGDYICASGCAEDCVNMLSGAADLLQFRAAVFNSVQ